MKEFSGHGPILGETPHTQAQNLQFQPQPTPLASCGSENPYVQRANQIGRIPYKEGDIHLAEYLPPPGWNIGDPPISPVQAFNLFVSEKLDLSRLTHVKNTDSAYHRTGFFAYVERYYRWNSHFQRVLLYERIEVFERDQLHKMKSYLLNNNKKELEKMEELQALQPPEPRVQWTTDLPKHVIPSAPKMFGGQTEFVVEKSSLRTQTGKRLIMSLF